MFLTIFSLQTEQIEVRLEAILIVFDSTLAYTPFFANILFKKKKKKRPLQTRESNYRIETIEIITNLNLEMRKRFQCEKCKEKFINNSNLKVHMKVKFKSNINKDIFFH